MPDELIRATDHDGIRELRLDRPPVNALSPRLLADLDRAVAAAPSEGARALVLSGREGMFTGGLDILELAKLDRSRMRDALGGFFAIMHTLAVSPIPVAAAITGHSPAGGLVLALFCDHRVMEDGTWQIGLNEVRIGIPMPATVVAAAARTVGPRRAEEMCTTGRLFTPREAQAYGLVDRVVEPGASVATAVAWCRDVTSVPPEALLLTRQRGRRDLVELVERHRDGDAVALLEAWFRPEMQTSLRALVERLGGRR